MRSTERMGKFIISTSVSSVTVKSGTESYFFEYKSQYYLSICFDYKNVLNLPL